MTGLRPPVPGEIATTPAQVLARLQAMQVHLAADEDPREAATIAKQADVLRYLARKADASAAVQNRAAEVGLRARRRAGELLAAAGPEKHDPTSRSVRELGITNSDSSRWQAVASVPEARFEGYIVETRQAGAELTTAGAVRLARSLETQRQRQAVDVDPPSGRFRCVVIDPPWPVHWVSGIDKLPGGLPYTTMSVGEIGALPLPDLVDPRGAHIFLWTPHRFLHDALHVLEGWGLRYQCQLTWVKNLGFTPLSWMYSTEHCLFARVGALPLTQMGLRLDFAAPRTRHSEKPPVFYERVAQASPEPRLEMFARRPRPGFEPWGDQVSADAG